MKSINRYITIFLVGVSVLLSSCTRDSAENINTSGQGTRLRMYASFGAFSRLAELDSPNQMGTGVAPDGKDYGLYNVGVYVYYADDYSQGILNKPYIRNMECTVRNGMLFPVENSSTGSQTSDIFIYDEMTIVAFYPYNSEMNLEENFFTVKSDEEKYPITRQQYSEQYFIPYRAQKTVDPTTAYYTDLTFYPKHTYKMQIVVVSDDSSLFPGENGLRILPDIDPVGNTDPTDNERAKWYDKITPYPDGGGGSDVMVYEAYIWTKGNNDNGIQKGEVLIESDKLTLISSQNLTVQEQHVYRYGYNLSTGEIFIPTSDNLIHDYPTLKAVNGSSGAAYQVCDIDVSGAGNWVPLNIYGGRYDGGGHKITGLTQNSTSGYGGLFGIVQGNTTVCNVNLIEPVINVENTIDTCYVGAICAKLNNPLSEADKQKLIANLPEDLSAVVKQAILAELLESALNSRSDIVACRVENPSITVNGLAPRVGSIVGQAGDVNDEGNYKSGIWDTYSLAGKISVNAGNEMLNEDAFVGGFSGITNGFITRSFTTIDQGDIIAQEEETEIVNGDPVTTYIDLFTGFTTLGDDFGPADIYVSNSYSSISDPLTAKLPDKWPGFPLYTDIWPVYTIGWLGSPGTSFWYSNGSSPSVYPLLQWERR